MWSKIITAGCLFSSACLAETAETPETPTSISSREFFEAQSGRIAVFPDVKTYSDAKGKIQFSYFPKNGTYKLSPKYSVLWLAVNHIVKRDIVQDDKKDYDPTFLAIQIICEYAEPYSPSENIYLYRVGNWVRSDDPQFNGKSELKRSFKNRTIADFFQFQGEKSTLDEFDKNFAKWHAQVDPNQENSWEFRQNWIKSDLSPSPRLLVKNYLIRFTPNTSGYSDNWLLFSTNVANERRVIIRTFAPTFDSPDLFDNEITLILK